MLSFSILQRKVTLTGIRWHGAVAVDTNNTCNTTQIPSQVHISPTSLRASDLSLSPRQKINHTTKISHACLPRIPLNDTCTFLYVSRSLFRNVGGLYVAQCTGLVAMDTLRPPSHACLELCQQAPEICLGTLMLNWPSSEPWIAFMTSLQ